MATQTFDAGFGRNSTVSGRLILADGTYNVKRLGIRYFDPYMKLVTMPWWQFFIWLFIAYLVINMIFGLLFFWSGLDHLDGVSAQEGFAGYLQALFFSIQTFTTVGYGAIHPTMGSAHVIASIDAFVGLMSIALATGLLFSRFSRPGKSIIFSDFPVVTAHGEGKALMFRIANLHNNKILDLEANIVATWIDHEAHGPARRYARLDLGFRRVFMFPLSWTIVHPIDEKSILHGLSEEQIVDRRLEFIVLVRGYDETYAQFVSASKSYTASEIKWNHKFKVMYQPSEDRIVLNLQEINATLQASTPMT